MKKINISPTPKTVSISSVLGPKNYKLFSAEYVDPYAGNDRAKVHEHSVRLANAAREHYASKNTAPKRKNKFEPDNPASNEIFDKKAYPSIHKWRTKHVPTAAALLPLQRPDMRTLSDGTPLSRAEVTWFEHVVDGIGLRSRAAAMEHILEANAAPGQKWLSLASGASLPILEAAHNVLAKKSYMVDVTAADFDKKALRLSAHLAKLFGVNTFSARRVNILDAKSLKKHIHGQYDVVEILGLFEYLRPADWKYAYSKVIKVSKKLLGAVNFLRTAFGYVSPGGLLIFGNMLDTHPHIGFTLDVVQWPHIQPRSVAEVVEIVEAALPDGDYTLDVYIPTDGVYAVYVLHKIR
jgi:hypothetical protein